MFFFLNVGLGNLMCWEILGKKRGRVFIDCRHFFKKITVPSLNLKIDSWKTMKFPFGARPSDRCYTRVN